MGYWKNTKSRGLALFLAFTLIVAYSVFLNPGQGAVNAKEQFSLHGYDATSESWTKGNLAGWYELDWVPYKMEIANAVEGAVYDFTIFHDMQEGGVDGIDDLRYPDVTGPDGATVTGWTWVDSPVVETSTDGATDLMGYHFRVSFPSDGTYEVHWEAHIAFGAHLWSGASLHTHAGDFFVDVDSVNVGKQDVPIAVNGLAPATINVHKEDDTGTGMPDITFDLYLDNPTVGVLDGADVLVATGTTDASGDLAFADLPPADYLVVETVPTGYTPDENPKTVSITVGANDLVVDPDPVVFVNHLELGSLTINKYDDGENPLGGATFDVSGPNGYSLTVTDNDANDEDPTDGVILLTGLELGTYDVTESAAPSGYDPDPDTESATLTVNDLDGSVSFYNSAIEGTLTIYKYDDAKNPLGGATFRVTGPNDYDLTVTDNDANDENPADGVILLTGLEPGTYTVVETAAPSGYDLDTDTETATLSEESRSDSVEFTNTAIEGTLTIYKYDDAGAPLGGATFQVTGPNGYDLTVTDNDANDENPSDGVIRLTGLEMGTYTVVETSAPSGYDLDTDTETATLTEESRSDSVEFTDTAITGTLTIYKYKDAGGQLGGATFRVTGPNDFDLTVTDNDANDTETEDGLIVLTGLELGTYSVTETAAPSGYEPDDSTETATLTVELPSRSVSFMNTAIAGTLTIHKMDEVEDPQGGATFHVTGPNDYDLSVTDNDGNDQNPADGLIVLTGLELGTYTVTETNAPDGYDIDTSTETATLTDESPSGDVYFMNYPTPVPELSITKERTTSSPAYVGDTVRFEITVTNDGNVDLYDVSVMDTYEDAYLDFVSVYQGTDEVTGVVPSSGVMSWYVGDLAVGESVTYTVTFEAANPVDLTEDEAVAEGYYNKTRYESDPAYDDVEILAVPEPGLRITKERTTPSPVYVGSSVVFDVTATNNGDVYLTAVRISDDYDPDYLDFVGIDGLGDIEPAGGELVWMVGSLDVGESVTYTVRFQAKAPTSETVNYALVEDLEEEIHDGPVSASVRIRERTEVEYGTLIIRKYVSGTSDPLGGATFEVDGPEWDDPITVVDGGAYDSDDDADGVIRFRDIELGTYTVVETEAPDGYTRDTDEESVRLTSSDRTGTVTFYNEPEHEVLPGSVRIVKVNSDGDRLGGAVFQLEVNGDLYPGTYMTADGTGTVTINDLPAGATVRVIEMTPPEGYDLVDPQTVTVVEGETVEVVFTDPSEIIIPPTPPEEEPLPNTGGSNMAMIIFGLLLTAAGFGLRRKDDLV